MPEDRKKGIVQRMKATRLIGIMTACVLAMVPLCGAAHAKKGAASKKALPDLGKVMYIGDSITHGFGAPSYRWPLHKIFVDNGIAYEAVGIETGNKSGGEAPGTEYMGVPFTNVHAAMSSQRSYETSGRNHSSPRLDGTDIFDWLGLDKSYEGPRTLKGDVPDTCFILLGTNDLLSDHWNAGLANSVDAVATDMLDKDKGDLSVIVDALRKVNKKARIVVLTMPTWGNIHRGTPNDYGIVHEDFNKKLAAWAKTKKVKVADVNNGLIDVAETEKRWKGYDSFFNAGDQLHPTRQGDIIIAGRVAQTLGLAGRSAGLPRKATAKFDNSATDVYEAASTKTDVTVAKDGLTVAPAGKLVSPWPKNSPTEKGFAVSLVPKVGDGEKGGWETAKGLSVSIGNGAHSGKLTITESYLKWNDDTVLISEDMSNAEGAVRVVWHPGAADRNVPTGFYVWLGDMLVGEALPDDGAGTKGVSVENTSDSSVTAGHFATDATPSAPAPKGYVKEEKILQKVTE